MKKNRLFVLGLVTVFVALVSLTFVSSTWAKYTTTVSGTDQARVAYWGFEETDTLEWDLFDAVYEDDVKSEDGDNLIAPGTSKTTHVEFNYQGTTKKPEVDYVLKFNTAGSDINDLVKNNTNIVWRAYLSGNTAPEYGTWQSMLDAIDSYQIAGEAAEARPTDLLVIEWQWLIGSTDEENARDTLMGNKDIDLNVVLKIAVTAEQVDR